MAISFSNALGVHEQALLLRDQRSSIIASNIANSDTPGYKARDFDFAAVLQQRMGMGGDSNTLELATSSERHIGAAEQGISDDMLLYRTPLQPSLDGNTVDEQLENAAFARNALEHQASFQFLNGKFTGLIKALRGE
ncbi:MAG: flagellar basal body rod protein FlgB [Pseudohongiellaceae bacterium]|nr:flagellar basal body rod protein FlgB [Pseudohongiellaceae bacterium]